jgi:hypothetical protein
MEETTLIEMTVLVILKLFFKLSPSLVIVIAQPS